MAVQGDLSDIDITSVIQVLCTERRRAGLVMRRRGEEGVIFFDNGEIVHAMLGPLEGEEAVYQLLSWRDGTFRMTDKVRTPSRTVRTGWNALLMEGMRKIDEDRRERGVNGSAGPQEDTEAWHHQEGDTALEGDLMLLLSSLEQSMTHLGEKKVSKRPLAAVEILCEMVNSLVAFVEKRSGAPERKLALGPVVNRAARKFAMARLLTIRSNRVSAQMALDLHRSWSSNRQERSRMFREICRGMVFITESYLELLAKQYHSGAMAEAWRESYMVFIRDLGRAVDRVRF